MKRKSSSMLSEKGNGVLSYGSHALRSEYQGLPDVEKSKKEPRKQKEILRSRKWKVMMDQ